MVSFKSVQQSWVLSLGWLSAAWALCPPTGPVLPPPVLSSDTLNLSSLKATLEGFESNSSNSEWVTNKTFFSVSVTTSKSTVFSFFKTPPVYNSSGTHEANGSSVQRVASVTKVFTTLAVLLQDNMRLSDPISAYVPELSAERWQHVTLAMLAGQHAGIARDDPVFDMAITDPLPFTKMGFPSLNGSELPKCSGDASQPPCSRSEFFNGFLKNNFTWLPGDKAGYSDLGFILLGYALENATGMSYPDIIEKSILAPLELHNTGFSTPELSNAVIPAQTPWFGLDIGNFNQAAGLYTTPDDLCSFMRAILNFKLLPGDLTRQWLKPGIFTSSLYSAVGMPWEILRPTTLTPTPRPVDLYTKDGDLPGAGYAAHVVLIPEYDAAIVLTGAGDDAFSAVTRLLNIVGEAVIPQLENLARSQAEATYAGRYVSASGNASEAELILTVDNGPGLKVSNWTNLGANMLDSLAEIRGNSGASSIDARLYPIGDSDRWRLQVESVSNTDSVYSGAISGQSCTTWTKVDQYRYGRLPVDELDFVLALGNGTKKVQGVRLNGLRGSLVKSS